MGRRAIAVLVCLAALAAQTAAARSSRQAAIPAGAAKAQPKSSLKAPLIDKGLRLADFAGMTPRAELKDKLLKISGFIQNTPHDGRAGDGSDRSVAGIYQERHLFCVYLP